MSRTYRLVYFETRPVEGMRIPIAAVVQHGDRLEVVQARKLPGADVLGAAVAHALAFALHLVELAARRGYVATVLGPQTWLDEPRGVPTAIEDAKAWLQRAVLPGGAVE